MQAQGVLFGQIAAGAGSLPALMAQARGGRIRVLASTGRGRSRYFPEIPTFEEQGFEGLDMREWHGIYVGGNWVNNGGFVSGSYGVNFNGTGAQYIGGSVTTYFYGVTISNLVGLTLQQNVYVAGNWVNNQIRLMFANSQPPVPLVPHYMVKSKQPVDAGAPSNAAYVHFDSPPTASFRKLEEDRFHLVVVGE